MMFKLSYKLLLTSGLVLIIFSNVNSQNCIDGTIVDTKSGAMLGGVSVTVMGTSVQATTNAGGAFTICQSPVNITEPVSLQSNQERLVFPVSIFDLHGTEVGSAVNEFVLANIFSQIGNGMYLMGNPNGENRISKVLVAGTFKNVSTSAITNLSQHRAKASAGGDIILEAEDMILNGYIIDLQYDGVRDMIMVDWNLPVPSSGTATTTFSGPSGTYNIDLYTGPENDGDLILKLFVAGKEILNEVYPYQSNYMRTEEKIFTIKGVAINNGDEIKIEGTSDESRRQKSCVCKLYA